MNRAENVYIPKGSIIPSNYCSNHINLDQNAGIYHMFRRLNRGKYEVLDHGIIKEKVFMNRNIEIV